MSNDDAAPDFDIAALERWMAQNVPAPSPVERIEKFPGGQSNPTYRVLTREGQMVLRRKPFGKLLPSAHAVDREYRLIEALHPTPVPVARPIALCEDPAVIGAPFYLMEMVEGRTFWKGELPDCDPQERRAIYNAMIDALAALHAVDHEAVCLGDYGAPGNYFARQVGRWTKQYRAAQTDDIPEVERLIDWLPRTLPQQDRTSIIHGDYRIDNMIYAPDRPAILAIIDWELSTLGDPIADFSYLMLNWHNPHDGRAGLEGLDLKELGIPSQDEAVERYVARTGYPVPPMDWYFAYNLFRLAGIMQGIKKRVIDGTASSAHAKSMSERVAPLVDRAYQFATAAGMD